MIPWIIVAVVVAIGLDHDQEGLPESELLSFFFVIHRRSDPQFGGDSVEQVLRGTFEGVPTVSFAHWHDRDDTFRNEMCYTVPLGDEPSCGRQ